VEKTKGDDMIYKEGRWLELKHEDLGWGDAFTDVMLVPSGAVVRTIVMDGDPDTYTTPSIAMTFVPDVGYGSFDWESTNE
jgi:hypothetical protein